MRFHGDERRVFWGDIFELPNGDVNVVILKPSVIIAWHRHQKQDDQLFLISGRLRVRVIADNGAPHTWTLTETQRGPVVIPRNRWHGYEAQEQHAVVLQFNGPGKYDGTDEERLSLEELPWNPTS